MNRFVREAGFAVLAWLIPLAFSMAIFPLKESQPKLFDTLMGVAVAASTALLGWLYIRRLAGGHLRAGIRIGIVWMLTNLLLDGLMFSGGPMKMTPAEYMADIGLAYLAIPAITIALGATAAAAALRAR